MQVPVLDDPSFVQASGLISEMVYVLHGIALLAVQFQSCSTHSNSFKVAYPLQVDYNWT